MKRIQIAPGIEMTDIAMGESRRGYPDCEQSAFEVMDRYVELGGNTFDSARLYSDGAADRALGKWIKSRGLRDSLTVVTKGSHPDRKNMFASRLTRRDIEGDLDESLAFMGLAYSDLHLLHRDDVRIPVEEIMPSLDALVRAGKTRAVGVSNWTAARIIEANQFALEKGLEPIRCCQLHFSLAQTTAAATGDITHVPMNDVEFGWYRESRLPVMCFGAHGRGWFAARARGEEPKEKPRRYYDMFPENHRRLARLLKTAETLGVSPAAVATAYVRDRGLNAVVLSSFSSRKQLEEAWEAETFRLTRAQLRYLETGVGAC